MENYYLKAVADMNGPHGEDCRSLYSPDLWEAVNYKKTAELLKRDTALYLLLCSRSNTSDNATKRMVKANGIIDPFEVELMPDQAWITIREASFLLGQNTNKTRRDFLSLEEKEVITREFVDSNQKRKGSIVSINRLVGEAMLEFIKIANHREFERNKPDNCPDWF